MLSTTRDSVKSFHESFYGTPTMDEPRRRRGKKRHPVVREEPQNEVAVVGMHYRSFDDDAMAAFVNSATALVPWNGDPKLLIDRYDVRHLLLDLTGIRRRRARPPSPDATKEELDYERYRDVEGLENPSPAEDSQATDGNDAGGYQRVGFNYGDLSASQEKADEALFTPPFFVPEHLRASVPTSSKLQQIMAGTAKYIIEHGGQAEIVLRVKQASNPVFGFLMPDHQDHEYFRFLVAHPEYVGIAPDPPPLEVAPSEKSEASIEDTEGGLSLLGTAYGASDDDEGEDEEAGPSVHREQDEQNDAGKRDDESAEVDDTLKDSDGQQKTGDLPSDELEAVAQSTEAEVSQGGENGAHSEEEPSPPGINEPIPSVSDNAVASNPVPELPFKEPPVQVGLIIDKMVEFISRNGKEFEAVVRERDKANQRFPFFLPWNEYHPYYSQKLKAAREAQTIGDQSTESYATLVGEPSGAKADQVSRKVVDDSFLTGVPFWDETFAVEAGDGINAAAIDSGGVSTPQPDDANEVHNQDGGMGFDAVLAAVRAATRGRPLGGEGAEEADLAKAIEIIERPETGSDEAVLAAIRAATGRAKPDLLVLVTKGENAQSESLDILADSVPGDSAAASTSVGAPSADVSDTSVGDTPLLATAEGKVSSPKTGSPLAGGNEAVSEVELSPSAKRKAERLKKAKLFAAMIKDRSGSHSSAGQPSVPSEAPDLTERLNLAVATSDNGNAPDGSFLVSTEVEAKKRDVIGTGQSADVQMRFAQEVDEGVGVESQRRLNSQDQDLKHGENNLKHLPTRSDKESRSDREESPVGDETKKQDHHPEPRTKGSKHRRHHDDSHERAVDKARHNRVKEPKEKADAGDEEDGHGEDRGHRDREHKRKRKESKHKHGEKKSGRRHGHESSESRKERRHEQDTEKVRKDSRYREDSVGHDRRDDRYGRGHSQDMDIERTDRRHRYPENQHSKDSSRYRYYSEEREKERERSKDDVEAIRKERSRRLDKRRKYREGSTDDNDEKYSERHERRSKKNRRRDDGVDERSGGQGSEEREDKSAGNGLERSDPAKGKSDEKPPASDKPALLSTDIPDDIRAKVRAMLFSVRSET